MQQQSVFYLEDVSSTLLRNIRAFHHIPEDSNLHNRPREDLKPTKQLTDLPTNQPTNQPTRMTSTFSLGPHNFASKQKPYAYTNQQNVLALY